MEKVDVLPEEEWEEKEDDSASKRPPLWTRLGKRVLDKMFGDLLNSNRSIPIGTLWEQRKMINLKKAYDQQDVRLYAKLIIQQVKRYRRSRLLLEDTNILKPKLAAVWEFLNSDLEKLASW